MAGIFITQSWLDKVIQYLNDDEKYGKVAVKWEGDIIIVVQPSGILEEELRIYMDLWHGECHAGRFLATDDEQEAKFVLSTTWDNILRILNGELDPMQAMLTRKLGVRGNMPYLMRNVPTVLHFVRCAQEVTAETQG